MTSHDQHIACLKIKRQQKKKQNTSTLVRRFKCVFAVVYRARRAVKLRTCCFKYIKLAQHNIFLVTLLSDSESSERIFICAPDIKNFFVLINKETRGKLCELSLWNYCESENRRKKRDIKTMKTKVILLLTVMAFCANECNSSAIPMWEYLSRDEKVRTQKGCLIARWE